jgi:hypothetical protein
MGHGQEGWNGGKGIDQEKDRAKRNERKFGHGSKESVNAGGFRWQEHTSETFSSYQPTRDEGGFQSREPLPETLGRMQRNYSPTFAQKRGGCGPPGSYMF